MFYHLNSCHLKEITQIVTFDNFAQFIEWKKKEDHESFSYQRKVRDTVVFQDESILYYKRYDLNMCVVSFSYQRKVKGTVVFHVLSYICIYFIVLIYFFIYFYRTNFRNIRPQERSIRSLF